MSNSGAACCRRSLQNTFDFLLVLSSSFDKILFPRWLGSAGGSQVFIWCCSEVPLMFILLTKILWILHVVLPWYTGLQLTLHQWELPSFHMDHFHDFTSYSFLSLYDIITWLLKHLNWCICLCHFSTTFKLSVWNISDCLSSIYFASSLHLLDSGECCLIFQLPITREPLEERLPFLLLFYIFYPGMDFFVWRQRCCGQLRQNIPHPLLDFQLVTRSYILYENLTWTWR